MDITEIVRKKAQSLGPLLQFFSIKIKDVHAEPGKLKRRSRPFTKPEIFKAFVRITYFEQKVNSATFGKGEGNIN